LGLLASLASGCATAVNGTTQPISLSSNPSGAEIYVDGQPMGKTPGVVTLSRGSDHHIELRKEGYLPHTVPLARQRSTATLGNIYVGGLVGMGVDALSGANYKFVPECYNANLSPEAPVVVFAPRTGYDEGVAPPGPPPPAQNATAMHRAKRQPHPLRAIRTDLEMYSSALHLHNGRPGILRDRPFGCE